MIKFALRDLVQLLALYDRIVVVRPDVLLSDIVVILP